MNERTAQDWVDALASVMERLVPDAITTSIFLHGGALRRSRWCWAASLTTTIDAYYRGLWMLLAFTMQMTLILVLSLILGGDAVLQGAVIALSRLPQDAARRSWSLAVLCGAFVAYLNWGLRSRCRRSSRSTSRAKPSAKASRSTSCS